MNVDFLVVNHCISCMNDEFFTLIGNGGYYTQNLLPGDYEYAVNREVRMPLSII